MNEHIISHLFVYPIKGLGGISIPSTKVFKEGFQYDRRWMLVDQKGVFVSQRSVQKMALLKTSLIDEGVLVTYADQSIVIPYEHALHKHEVVSIWEHIVSAATMPNQFNEWFSDILSLEVKLVYYSVNTKREKTFLHAPFTSPVSFADGYPILVLGEASLIELNTRLEVPLGYDRFRPNMVVSTNIPHEEDLWGDLTINNVKSKCIKPCARCIVPTINQKTGVKGKEPLATLNKYRKVGNVIHFGANVIVLNEGFIQVGDQVIHKN